MAPIDLNALFWSGGAIFTAAFAAGAVLTVYLWRWRRRPTPAHLFVFALGALMVLYFSLLVDTMVRMRRDGVDVQWLRPWVSTATFVLVAEAVCDSLWILDYDARIILAAQLLSGLSSLAAEVTRRHVNWWWWGAAFVLQAIAQLWALRRATRPHLASWVIWSGGMVLPGAVLGVQALSWSMGQVLDVSPQRAYSELAYAFAYGFGVPVFGVVCVVLYTTPKYDNDAVTPAHKTAAAASNKRDLRPATRAPQPFPRALPSKTTSLPPPLQQSASSVIGVAEPHLRVNARSFSTR